MKIPPFFLVLMLLLSRPVDARADAPLAPATVLNHEVDIAIDSGLRRSDTITWTLRIDDPAACKAGLIAPKALDGASDAGAQVFEDLLLIPENTPPGTTFTLKRRIQHPKGSHSDVFLTAPDLPVERARMQVSAPSWVPLHVWSDAGGHPDYAHRNGQQVTVTWDAIAADEEGQLVFSTWSDWMSAGDAVMAHVDRSLADKDALGRRLAANSTSLGVGESMDRVYAEVDTEEGNYGSWLTARTAAETLKAGTGSAADRGMVLLSVLRLSGLDAMPATARLASSRGGFPVMVPAPTLLERPVIAIRRDDGLTWIDPSNELSAPGDLPAALMGGSAWIPGDLPVDIQSSTLVDGRVSINTNLTLRADGSSNWTATIGASGSAAEALRDLLGEVDDTGRTATLKRLAQQARPSLQRFSVAATGLQRTDRPVKLTLSGQDADAMTPFGAGLTGSIPPVIAPALGGWLPPNIRVREAISIAAPPGLQILAASPPPPISHDLALVSRHYERQAQRANITVEVERPYRSSSAIREADATAFLAEQAPIGAGLLLFPPANGAVASSIRSSAHPPSQRTAIEALLWWRAQNRRKPLTLIRRAADRDLAGLISAIDEWAEPGDPNPWDGLATIAAERGDGVSTVEVATAMANRGRVRQAWLLAATLRNHFDAKVRLDALLMMESLQPTDEPDPQSDPEGARAWSPSEALLKEAGAVSEELGLNPNPDLLTRRAQIALDEGRAAEAEALLTQVLTDKPAPLATILLAHSAALSGVSRNQVIDHVEQALQSAPFDAVIASRAARVAAVLRDTERAKDYATSAARLGFDDAELWSDVVDYAIRDGDLPSAGVAARRASDLQPHLPAMGHDLALLSTLLNDKDGAVLGASRAQDFALSGEWPLPLNRLMEMAPENALLGLLEYHDTAVVADAGLLSIRAQMRVDRSDLDSAARDGILLTTRHDRKDGEALAFAATAGRLYSSTLLKRLSDATTNPTARMTRMEFRLISGLSGAVADARALGDDPRARILVDQSSAPRTSAEALEGWPAGLNDVKMPSPSGYLVNRTLGAAPGVLAWSNADSATAILITSQVTGILPPPLGQLYTQNERPLETLEDGSQILELEGGVIPLYVAIKVRDGREVLGLGFTIPAATRALQTATQ